MNFVLKLLTVLLKSEYDVQTTVYVVAISTVVMLITVFCAVGVAVCIKLYQRKNESTVFHGQTVKPNEANGITDGHELTQQSNEAYGITDAHKVTAQPNEAYGITDAHELTVQPNEAYGITDAHEVTVKHIEESEDTEYSYVQNN